jgi:gluconokinase
MIVILMGVTACGKTTVGAHPAKNVAKMKRGVPLTDEDRWPWLDRLNGLLVDAEREGRSLTLACSALKQAYRERLARGCTSVRFVLLDGDEELIRSRLAARRGHYMNPNLLTSQFEILERPQDALRVDAAEDPATLTRTIRKALAL